LIGDTPAPRSGG